MLNVSELVLLMFINDIYVYLGSVGDFLIYIYIYIYIYI